MSGDRVQLNTPETWTGPNYALDMVDEIVVTGGLTHFEMSDDSSGYLAIYRDGKTLFCRVYARPTTKEERREIREAGDLPPMAVLCVEVEENELVPDEDHATPSGEAT
jgi:hypothetical protein